MGSKSLPVSTNKVITFIGFLNCNNLSSSTVLSYVSAIGFVHRFKGLTDPTSTTVVHKLLAAANKFKPKMDSRLPITLIILHNLVQSLRHTVSNPYTRTLFHAMYVVAFFGLMRIGEITQSKDGVVALYLDQLQVFQNYIIITISHFKHNVSLRPIQLVLPSQSDPVICPVQAIKSYLSVRGFEPGPLFTFVDGAPIKRDFFTKGLKDSLNFCGLDTKYFKSHSFRIGAASYYASLGLTDAQLRLIGRWNSDAFLKYIRCQRVLLAVQNHTHHLSINTP